WLIPARVAAQGFRIPCGAQSRIDGIVREGRVRRDLQDRFGHLYLDHLSVGASRRPARNNRGRRNATDDGSRCDEPLEDRRGSAWGGGALGGAVVGGTGGPWAAGPPADPGRQPC